MSVLKDPRFQDFENAFSGLSEMLGRKNLKSICFIYGDQDALGILVRNFVLNSVRSWDDTECVSIDCTEAKAINVLNDISERSIFDSRRILIASRAEKKIDLVKKILDLFRNGIEATQLILFWEKTVVPVELSKKLSQLGAEVFFLPLPEVSTAEIRHVVRWMAGQEKVKLTSDAIDALVKLNGVDLAKIHNELRKYSLTFLDKTTALTGDDILDQSPSLKEEHAFILNQYLLDRDFSRAHRLIKELLDRGDSALAVLGLLNRHIRILLLLCADGGGLAKDFGRQDQKTFLLRMPTGILNKYKGLAVKYSMNRLVELQRLIQEADVALKSSSKADEILLAHLVEDICAIASVANR